MREPRSQPRATDSGTPLAEANGMKPERGTRGPAASAPSDRKRNADEALVRPRKSRRTGMTSAVPVGEAPAFSRQDLQLVLDGNHTDGDLCFLTLRQRMPGLGRSHFERTMAQHFPAEFNMLQFEGEFEASATALNTLRSRRARQANGSAANGTSAASSTPAPIATALVPPAALAPPAAVAVIAPGPAAPIAALVPPAALAAAPLLHRQGWRMYDLRRPADVVAYLADGPQETLEFRQRRVVYLSEPQPPTITFDRVQQIWNARDPSIQAEPARTGTVQAVPAAAFVAAWAAASGENDRAKQASQSLGLCRASFHRGAAIQAPDWAARNIVQHLASVPANFLQAFQQVYRGPGGGVGSHAIFRHLIGLQDQTCVKTLVALAFLGGHLSPADYKAFEDGRVSSTPSYWHRYRGYLRGQHSVDGQPNEVHRMYLTKIRERDHAFMSCAATLKYHLRLESIPAPRVLKRWRKAKDDRLQDGDDDRTAVNQVWAARQDECRRYGIHSSNDLRLALQAIRAR